MEHRLTRVFAERTPNGERVLYWMQASVRVRDNLALAWAQREARDRNLPLDVLFCLDLTSSQVTVRSCKVLLDGLQDVSRGLRDLGLTLTVALSQAVPAVTAAGNRAAVMVFDRSYLPDQRRDRMEIARALTCPVIMAEDNATVPVHQVSSKEEWAAATLRPKLIRLASLEQPFIQALPGLAKERPDRMAEELQQAGIAVLDTEPSRSLVARLPVDHSVGAVDFVGGESAAWAQWEEFRDRRLLTYDQDRHDPNRDGVSGLSPAFHFGYLSPVSLLNDLRNRALWTEPTSFRQAGEDGPSKFIDEFVVRRELSFNFVLYNAFHATWQGLPSWARATLERHTIDPRTATYDRAAWESRGTHDPVWNAAQFQLASTGTLHGYLRMYWGKKLLEWSSNPIQAFEDALYLNNKYALDGHDPNSYAGVAWCFGKHDRPWPERSIYGSVRSMMISGLKKRFDVEAYLRRFTPPS